MNTAHTKKRMLQLEEENEALRTENRTLREENRHWHRLYDQSQTQRQFLNLFRYDGTPQKEAAHEA